MICISVLASRFVSEFLLRFPLMMAYKQINPLLPLVVCGHGVYHSNRKLGQDTFISCPEHWLGNLDFQRLPNATLGFMYGQSLKFFENTSILPISTILKQHGVSLKSANIIFRTS